MSSRQINIKKRNNNNNNKICVKFNLKAVKKAFNSSVNKIAAIADPFYHSALVKQTRKNDFICMLCCMTFPSTLDSFHSPLRTETNLMKSARLYT